jgi:hypothetical protein
VSLRLAIILLFVAVSPIVAQEKKTREQKVREDKARVEAEGFWLYNDLPGAFEKARQTGKPILVVLRCLPCEECVKLDDELVDRDPVIQPLLKEFVCVRVVGTNGLDLNTFQYDTDQSFAVFALNADGTIYGRFGTRSHRTEWIGDVSLAGMGKALQGALDLHGNYPANKDSLAGKRGPEFLVSSPEKFPSLKDQYDSTLHYEGNVVKSCIHCHQIGDAQREWYRDRNEAIPEPVLYPYPHPKSIGLTLDPKEMATVTAVEADSPAGRAGFEPGDEIQSLDGQPLISMADVQWVLQQTPSKGADLAALVTRGGKAVSMTIPLADGWRRADDIGWRVSSWGLRRMVTGGLLLEEISAKDRKAAGSPAEGMALRVKHVGQYGPHAAAKQAGFQEGDVIIAYDGRTDLLRDSDLLAYGATKTRPGDKVTVKLLRGGQEQTLQLPMQK